MGSPITESSNNNNENENVQQTLRSIPGNEKCADCGQAEPEWASCNLGIVLCITCSGIHRGLGRHISKVRSLTLDRWEPELIQLMTALGNINVARVYENKILSGEIDAKLPIASSDRPTKEKWIMKKYLKKDFVESIAAGQNLNDLFYDSVKNGNTLETLRYLGIFFLILNRKKIFINYFFL